MALKSSTALKCDNQGAIHLACNPVYHSKTKNLDLDAHYICGLMVDGILSLQYCPTEQQAPDIFTKSFTKEKFVHLCSLFGMREVVNQGGVVMTPSFLSFSMGPSPSHY